SPAMIAGEPADLGQEGVARASCVELGDEIDRRLQTRALAPISERLGTEVLVHVPHPAPFSLRRSRQESRAALAETECRQPALRDEAGGARRRRQQVRGEQLRRVRDAAAPRDAAHIHDVRLPFALDDVDAVEVDAEGPAAAPRDLAQLRTGCERLPASVLLGPDGKDLFDAEQASTYHVDLPVAALGRVIALREDRVSAGPHGLQFGDGADDSHTD